MVCATFTDLGCCYCCCCCDCRATPTIKFAIQQAIFALQLSSHTNNSCFRSLRLAAQADTVHILPLSRPQARQSQENSYLTPAITRPPRYSRASYYSSRLCRFCSTRLSAFPSHRFTRSLRIRFLKRSTPRYHSTTSQTMASGQNLQLTHGALFLIDNTGPCPTGKRYRSFIDAAITHHLTQHTYYYQDRGRPGAKNTKRATLRKIRNTILALWENLKPEFRSRKDGDRVEALFTLKSEAITARALKMYGYNPETFSESDLPGFVDDGGENLESREQTKTASTLAPQELQVHAPKSNLEISHKSQQNAAEQLRTEESIADTNREVPTSHILCSPQELPAVPSMHAKRRMEPSDESEQHAAKRARTSEDPVTDVHLEVIVANAALQALYAFKEGLRPSATLSAMQNCRHRSRRLRWFGDFWTRRQPSCDREQRCSFSIQCRNPSSDISPTSNSTSWAPGRLEERAGVIR